MSEENRNDGTGSCVMTDEELSEITGGRNIADIVSDITTKWTAVPRKIREQTITVLRKDGVNAAKQFASKALEKCPGLLYLCDDIYL